MRCFVYSLEIWVKIYQAPLSKISPLSYFCFGIVPVEGYDKFIVNLTPCFQTFSSMCFAQNEFFFVTNTITLSKECSIAAFGHGVPGSDPGWFAVSNSNIKYKSVVLQYYYNPAMRATFIGGDK